MLANLNTIHFLESVILKISPSTNHTIFRMVGLLYITIYTYCGYHCFYPYISCYLITNGSLHIYKCHNTFSVIISAVWYQAFAALHHLYSLKELKIQAFIFTTEEDFWHDWKPL